MLKKNIYNKEDIQKFWKSDGKCFLEYIRGLLRDIRGKGCGEAKLSPRGQMVSDMFSELDNLIGEVPLEDNKVTGRFGNIGYRTYYDRCREVIKKHELGVAEGALKEELDEYLLNAMGDYQRIDYGTGHELNFLCWCYGLHKHGYMDSLVETGLELYGMYLRHVRKLQWTFWLEPAGSQGAWGLDDYQYLPFLLGATQLVGHEYIRPKSSVHEEIVDMFYQSYLYLNQIRYIKQTKNMPLMYHSPRILEIASASSWRDVSRDLYIGYKKEVLSQIPVMQHFLVGEKILSYKDTDDDGRAKKEYIGDCCGNRIPSAPSSGKRRFPCD